MPSASVVLALCMSALVLWPSSSFADPRVDQARKLVTGLKFAEAAVLLDALEADTSLEPDDSVAVFELAGIVQATLRHPERAVTLFQKMFSLDPAHQLAEQYSPRVMTPYYQAKGWLREAGGPLTFGRSAPASSGNEYTALRFAVKNDALRLATQVRVHWRAGAGDWQTVVVAAAPLVEVAVKGAAIESWAELLGAGARVWKRLDSAAAPFRDVLSPPAVAAAAPTPVKLAPTPVEPPPVPPLVAAPQPAPRPSTAKLVGYVLAGLGAATFGVGAGFGISSSVTRTQFRDSPVDANGRSTVYTLREAEELSRQVQQQAFIANTLFGVGGGLLLAGVTTWIIGAVTGEAR